MSILSPTMAMKLVRDKNPIVADKIDILDIISDIDQIRKSSAQMRLRSDQRKSDQIRPSNHTADRFK
eukprot:860647-Amphidinium_carterae.1